MPSPAESRDKSERPVIRKIIRKGKHQRHGGAWKVAYADFMTAMMAFFLLLWLLSEAPQERSEALAAYFNPQVQLSNVGADGVLEGKGIDPESGLFASGAELAEEPESAVAGPSSETTDSRPAARTDNPWLGFSDGDGGEAGSPPGMAPPQPDPDPSLTQAFETIGAFLDTRRDQAHVSIAPDGALLVDLLDPAGSPLFVSGGAALSGGQEALLKGLVERLQTTPGRIWLIGHSDSAPLNKGEYTNWELSSDRAHSLRRALIAAGLDPVRIVSVSGVADMEPMDPEAPDAALNRRVTMRIAP